jgi:ornithine carbamoyltransferase
MDFLSLEALDLKAVNKIFEMADQLRNQSEMLLEGKTFALFFPESSIRTRLSFEKGIKTLGGACIVFPPSSLDKREALMDVSNYIGNWADAIVVRHQEYDKVCELAKGSNVPIINGMTSNNHPCEILSDLYSISRLREDYLKLTYTFVGGDGNILNSWIAAADLFGFTLNHVSIEEYKVKENSASYQFFTSLEAVLEVSDIVLTDPLPKELRVDAYYKKYQITLDRMKQCRSKSMLNPCPPFYRGEEVSEDVIESEYFVGYKFKENLIYVQQAIILYCLGISV